MLARRVTASLMVVLSMSSVPASGAVAPPSSTPNASFRAWTSGSPSPTVRGRWVLDGDSAWLAISGGHAVGSRTAFRAVFRTALARYPKPWEFLASHFLGGQTEREVFLTESFRYRGKGGDWSPWTSMTKDWDAGQVSTSGEFRYEQPPSRERIWQFEWRLKGVLPAKAALIGLYRLEVATLVRE